MALKSGQLVAHLVELIELKTEQLKLAFLSKLSDTLAALLSLLIVSFLLLMAILFLSFAAAIWLNTLFHSPTVGYLIIAGGYSLGLLYMVFLVKSGKLKERIEKALVEQLEQETAKQEDE